MSSITAFFYGYKSKELPEAVSALLNNKSDQNTVSVIVFDQINVVRDQKFDSVAEYNHIYWDNRKSPFTYLEQTIANSNTDFFLYINGAIEFEKNWDIELVMGHGGRNVVISGNHTISFNNINHKFYPTYTQGNTNTAVVTNWITNDFIFMKTSDFKKFPTLSPHLKHLGIEEVFSLFSIYSGLTIQCIATAWCRRIDGGIYNHDYYPYSLKHGYNLINEIFKKKNNIFFNDTSSVDVLSRIVGFDFNKLSPLPFMIDDVMYDPVMEMDSIGEERFIAGVRAIR